jgi:hypothetical protein
VNGVVYLLVCLVLTQVATAEKFLLPVLPDTQCEVNYAPAMFTSQMEWIAKNKKSLNIPMVLHVGDLVDFDNLKQYATASLGFKILDRARIPYAIALGNHDTSAVGENTGSAAPGDTHYNLRLTDKFNATFPVRRFTAQKGRFEPKQSDNAFYTFKAGGVHWLVVTLEFCARQAAAEWASKILAAHPKHNAIILTHYHLNGDGRISGRNAGYGDLSPQAVYDQVISQHANVRLVLSGHTGNSARREDVGAQGNRIYQILQDYQNLERGGGYIRLLEIDPGAGTISAAMYSPFYDRSMDDATNRFSFSGVQFIGAKPR